ncbi:hypothetical protein ACHQM5_017893 [Ranunculus cassubicifolius]
MRDDIAEEILLRLPVKSLVRCKSLSKDWQDFISRNPSFRRRFIERNKGCSFMVGFYVTKHMEFLESDEELHFLPTYNRGISVINKTKRNDVSRCLQLDKPLKKKRRFERSLSPALLLKKSPNFFSDPAVRVLGSSNGFLLCSLDAECPMNYIIINPINKLCVSLPVVTASKDYYSHGFICRSTSPQLDTIDYYKVVRGTSPQEWLKTSPMKLEIISSDSSRWSSVSVRGVLPFELDSSTPSKIIISETGLIYVPGWVHGEEGGSAKFDQGVIIFDDSKEEPVQRIEEFPPTENDSICGDLFGESEGLILYARSEPGKLKVWSMNDHVGGGGWNLIHNVSLESWLQIYPELFKYSKHLQFLLEGFHPTNKNAIFICGDDRHKLVYDMDKSKVESFCDLETQGWESVYYFFPYTCGLIGPHLFLCD